LVEIVGMVGATYRRGTLWTSDTAFLNLDNKNFTTHDRS
jgi:hypothetical protein